MNQIDAEILFAEDNLDDAMLSIRALAKSGFTNRVCHVEDGVQALDYIYRRGDYASRQNAEQPKLILLDLNMPKISGMQVLEILKTDSTTKSIPIVILTSSGDSPDIKKCYALGANSYIVKPVESDNFFQVIKELGLYWMVRNRAQD
ncbi:MAG TPA: response regulator [Cyclobacteriaceae bacterium]|nr:response regulator [Cyclobacteriaceae bacterium]